ncbi:MAG TPA: peptidylprolyl isomerase [Candidatus Binataceae bacterium]|nr:peptidylprolyl isomerase [Candidatus Binataceae bacterium]
MATGTAADIAAAVPYTPPPPPPVDGAVIDSVVASVDGTPVTSQDVASFSTKDPTDNSPDDASSDDPNAKLKAIIGQQLMASEAEKYASVVSETDVDHYIENLEQRNQITDEQLRAQLQAQNVSYASFRQRVRRQLEAMAAFQKEVRDKIVVSDADIEQFYKDHADEFTVTDEKYQLAQVLIAVPPNAPPQTVATARARAEDVQKQAAAGADFADLARRYSDDDSKDKGGELGVFSPNDLNDNILAGIKNLKPGEVSKVIRTKYGFHILKVEAHQVPGRTPLAEVKSTIRERIQFERSKSDLQQWVDQDLVKSHYVETNPE